MKANELLETLSSQYNKHFPNSLAVVHKGCLGESYYLDCYLGNKETFTNGISHNDQMNHTYWIHDCSNENYYIVECEGIKLYCNTTDPYRCMDGVRIPYRVKKGTPEKIINDFEKHFKKVYDIIQNNKERIYDVEELKNIL